MHGRGWEKGGGSVEVCRIGWERTDGSGGSGEEGEEALWRWEGEEDGRGSVCWRRGEGEGLGDWWREERERQKRGVWVEREE